MKTLLAKFFLLLSIISLFGCFNDKQDKDLSEVKVVKNGNITEVYSTSSLNGIEFEIKGLLNENEIEINPNLLSIVKHNKGNTILSIASTSTNSSNIKLFSVNKPKFDFKTINSVTNDNNISTKAIAPIEEAKKCDFDSNKNINLIDFITFTKSYGLIYKTLVSGSPDINGDYQVNLYDLVIFARNYGNLIDSVDSIEYLRKDNTFNYYAGEALSGIEFQINSAILTENIIVDDKTLKIIKNTTGTTLAITTLNKVFPKDSKLFSIINCSEPLSITITKKIPATATYEFVSLPTKNHDTAGNYILKSYSDWLEVCGNLLTKTDIGVLDFDNYDYIASFAGQRPNSGYGMTLTSFIETDSSISITYSESVPSISGIYLQVISYPRVLIKIPKTSKKIVFTSTTQYTVPKLTVEVPQSLIAIEGSITVSPEGANSVKYNFTDVINKKSVIAISPEVKYTISFNLTGYAEYTRVFTVQGGDKYIYLDNLTPIQDGIFFNNNGVLTAAVSTVDNITNAKAYNYQSANSGKLSLDIYNNNSLVISKSIDVLPMKNYQFIYYNYGEGSKENKIEAFETDSKIKLDIYSNGWGTLIGRKYLNEGSHSVSVYELNPYSGGNNYFGYATKDGYYTKLYSWTTNSIDLNLDPVEEDSNVHGAFFFDEGFFADSPINNTTITVSKNGVTLNSFKTDANGKYSFAFVPGIYDISFNYEAFSYKHSITITNKYQDFIIPCQIQAKKPNIYLYPTKTTKMNVILDFPNGGKVVESIPDYGTGWNNITVEPNGTINGIYTYLFYESDSNDFSQYSEGWVIKKENLESFFRKNMTSYGFRGQEIEDFIEYWIPLLKDSASYAIYPQLDKDISKEVVLNISQKPDSLLRLIYTVKPCNSMLNLKTPVIPAFTRTGFTVTEWGVVMK
jgi:hypothetical protein